MKLKFWNIILILALFFGCQNNRNLNGNYSTCYDGEYTEVYFKQDSMRIASKNEWVELSEWRKVKISNDILHFETFGEWRDNAKAEIKYVGINKIELRILETDVKLDLDPINENLNFEKPKEFWNKFHNRLNSKNCD